MHFGIWSALAIHDISSAAGATMQYGAQAREIATTIKLTRALWIVPITLVVGMMWNRGKNEAGTGKAKWPRFILGLSGGGPGNVASSLKPTGHVVFVAAQRSLVITLFLIGCGLSRSALQAVGKCP
jgi:uncharacterized membrane protein YadS